jgi:tetratricopeptide (TPR) repeat protein
VRYVSIKLAACLVTVLSAALVSPGQAKDLILKNDKPAATPQVAPAAAPAAVGPNRLARKPQAIQVAPAEGQSLESAWNDLFASRGDSLAELGSLTAEQRSAKLQFEADVRETVRQRMSAKQYDEVIVMLHAALRQGHPQPWMYQALGLAMMANNAPQQEVERAMMSVLDFAGHDAAQLAYVAQYLARIGMNERALSLLRQATELEPTRPEHWINAFALAQLSGDPQQVRWTTVGVLSQAWPADQKHVRDEAISHAQAAVSQLRRQNRASEADQLEADIRHALSRDLVIRVTWTGNADVDISVVEPTGEICSLRTPRTMAGGVLLGDSFARLERSAAEGFSEVYECPQGFSGQYQLLVRRIWGKVTADKVTVEVISHHNSPQQKSVAAQVELAEGVNVIKFDLAEGRRTEPLEQHQVAHALREQALLGRHLLAQQLGQSFDPQTVQALQATRAQQVGLYPFFPPQGAVGYRPIITVLPQGANLGATAVISADRRYVRITCRPVFSEIGKVLAFNINTGEITDGDPDL